MWIDSSLDKLSSANLGLFHMVILRKFLAMSPIANNRRKSWTKSHTHVKANSIPKETAWHLRSWGSLWHNCCLCKTWTIDTPSSQIPMKKTELPSEVHVLRSWRGDSALIPFSRGTGVSCSPISSAHGWPRQRGTVSLQVVSRVSGTCFWPHHPCYLRWLISKVGSRMVTSVTSALGAHLPLTQ